MAVEQKYEGFWEIVPCEINVAHQRPAQNFLRTPDREFSLGKFVHTFEIPGTFLFGSKAAATQTSRENKLQGVASPVGKWGDSTLTAQRNALL